MPPPLANQRFLRDGCQVATGGNQKGAAPHRGVQNAQVEDCIRRPTVDQRVERPANEKTCDGARRIEGAGRFAGVAGANETDGLSGGLRLIVEDSLIDGAELLDIEIAVRDPGARAARSGRADRHDRVREDRVVDGRAIECLGVGRREQPSVESGDRQFACRAAGMGQV